MAVLKSKPPLKHPKAGAASQLAAILSAFLARCLTLGQPQARLCVGLSGGRDSVVLLHALSRLVVSGDIPIMLSALHVHHGISLNSDAWAEFCAEFCRHCTVQLDIVHVIVPRDSGEGLEAAARRRRHAVFSSCSADFLVLAHHRDDQAETVLLNLLRGAGVAGAAGMLAERPQPSGPVLVRPFLDVPRSVLEDYAAEQGLYWIDDESNEDVHYRRNFLRREVLPQVEQKFPHARKSLARAAGHFAEAAQLLDDLASIDRASLSSRAGRIGLPGFNVLAPARARNLLRFEWVAAGFSAPDTRWIDEALKQLARTDALSETCLTTPDGKLYVYRGELYVVRHCPATPVEPLFWAGESELPWGGGCVRFVARVGAGLRPDVLSKSQVMLMSRQGGERLKLHAGRPHRNLKNLLQEAAIPPWERARLPFLWCNEKLAWVGGLGVDMAFVCGPAETGILPVWESGL